MTHPGLSRFQGTKFISLNMLINGARSCPDRVVDILEACGALDLSSSLSRDVIFISVLSVFFFSVFSFSLFFLYLRFFFFSFFFQPSFFLMILGFISSYLLISRITLPSFFDSINFPCPFLLSTLCSFCFLSFASKS